MTVQNPCALCVLFKGGRSDGWRRVQTTGAIEVVTKTPGKEEKRDQGRGRQEGQREINVEVPGFAVLQIPRKALSNCYRICSFDDLSLLHPFPSRIIAAWHAVFTQPLLLHAHVTLWSSVIPLKRVFSFLPGTVTEAPTAYDPLTLDLPETISGQSNPPFCCIYTKYKCVMFCSSFSFADLQSCAHRHHTATEYSSHTTSLFLFLDPRPGI